MDDENGEGKLFSTFDRHREFADAQSALLKFDCNVEPSPEADRSETLLLKKLTDILSEYQEQSYLLDPFLDELVVPIVGTLKTYAQCSLKEKSSDRPTTRVGRVSLLLYNFIKCRGYKTITRYFPHEIADLPIALDFIMIPNGPAHQADQWALRYVLLLWLSLICMIPFDLSLFDPEASPGYIATTLETLARRFLPNAGLERDAAATLLSRLYMRKDVQPQFGRFLDQTNAELTQSLDSLTAMGTLQVLSEVAKSAPSEFIQGHLDALYGVAQLAQQDDTLMANTSVRKLRVKVASRCALRLIPGRTDVGRRKEEPLSTDDKEDEEFDFPEVVESILEDLFQSLQDKDTIVRYSAAKGLARISERLSRDYADQVLDTTLALFSIHSEAVASFYDMPAIAEATWHGACLACAEMARRGLVSDSRLSEVIKWLSKALYFDIRKGAHSIGSSVRDAAAYIIWSLARAQAPTALEPYANNLARRLVAVSLFDREIHIRRASSAAFQEHVGRTGLFPHGIDVLRKTDFYAVGIRRNAFLVAAPQVAEHQEYRGFLIDHIMEITLRHWDASMRQLGAQSLRAICELELLALGPSSAAKAARLLECPDSGDIHGGLLALNEIAAAYRASGQANNTMEGHKKAAFRYLAIVPIQIVLSPRNALITEAACYLISNSISAAEIELREHSSVPQWRSIIDAGLRHRSDAVQEAAATALAAVSSLEDSSGVIERIIHEFQTGSSVLQQSLTRLLGILDYTACPQALTAAVTCLLESVDRSSPRMMANVEARRNSYLSMPQVVRKLSPDVSRDLDPSVIRDLFGSLLVGLTDYSVDERGDVGSWVRIACIDGLTSLAEMLVVGTSAVERLGDYIPADKYHDAIAGILKQGVERLDNVRQHAGEHFLRLLQHPAPPASAWRIEGFALMQELFLSDSAAVGWNEGTWIFPRAVRLLDIQRYRASVLDGIIYSMASKTPSTQRPVSSNLVSYVHGLPIGSADGSTYDILSLIRELLERANRNITSNAVVVPVFQTITALMEGDALLRLQEDAGGLNSLRTLLQLASRNVSRLKSVQRIQESMKIIMNLLTFAEMCSDVVLHVGAFLGHNMPRIRGDAAEYLYLLLQTKDIARDTDEAEELLLEIEWTSVDVAAAREAAERVRAALE